MASMAITSVEDGTQAQRRGFCNHMQLLAGETKGTLQRMCVSNAETMVAKCGGSVVFGYSVFQGAKHWYLERHAVYKSPDGELQDPTPSIYGYCVEPYTCFVECLVEFEHVGCVNMGQAHTVWMDKQELRRTKRNGWHGETIYMEKK
jgi:hypothetical protein